MQTECTAELFEFAPVDRRRVEAAFDGGQVTSDAGAVLLARTDRAIGLIDRFAGCFQDVRLSSLVEHPLRVLIAQRVMGLALGYEDLIDHDHLRHDPALAAAIGKMEAKREDCAALAGKSTLNRLEHAPSWLGLSRYHKIGHDAKAIERLFVDIFLEAHDAAPDRIILDLDATDDPLHGHQEGRFFHGYYDCYCYLPLYIFCGRHLLAAKLRRSNIDGSAGSQEEVARIVEQIRHRWPKVRILLRADSGFAREALMAWCESNGVNYVFGLPGTKPLSKKVDDAADAIRVQRAEESSDVVRGYAETRHKAKSWNKERRAVARIEATKLGLDVRFVVTNLEHGSPEWLYDSFYCARGQAENLIKLHKTQLSSDRTSCRSAIANQVRLVLHTAPTG